MSAAVRRRCRPVGLLVALALAIAACGDSATGPQSPEDVTFAASLGIDLAAMTRLPSGVFIQTVTEGVGVPMTLTDRFTVVYQGWTSDGNGFDSGTLQDVSFGGLIVGFEGMVGTVGMRVGETRRLVIPSQLGYGSAGAGDAIPGDAVLVFEVTLVAINP